MRHAYLLLGWSCFGLGAVGAVVPGLPTVPLMLVALWAFSKSSQRFHDWLYSHPVFGPPLQQWRVHRVIPLKAKVIAAVSMAASLAYMAFFADISGWVVAIAALVMLAGLVFIIGRPSHVQE